MFRNTRVHFISCEDLGAPEVRDHYTADIWFCALCTNRPGESHKQAQGCEVAASLPVA